jgi:hypothetical protein
LKLAYFVHDLGDPAVAKRVRMLTAAGVNVEIAGFRREPAPVSAVAGRPVTDLGQTHDGRLIHRALKVAGLMRSDALRRLAAGADVILARNLERLALAQAARTRARSSARLVYECLDVHRAMIGSGVVATCLRRIERDLLARADLLIVSSPAFLTNHFDRQRGDGPRRPETAVVENKVCVGCAPARSSPRRPGPPWRVGWLGVLRCRRSLDVLAELAARRPDLLNVVIRGRPSQTELPQLTACLPASPATAFGGPYRAEELPGIYRSVHFTWAVDWFDRGCNSDWLLPNRLYEGGLYGAPPIAQAGTETARWLQQRGLGVVLPDPARDLEGFLERLTARDYTALEQAMLTHPRRDFTADLRDCSALVAALEGAPA